MNEEERRAKKTAIMEKSFECYADNGFYGTGMKALTEYCGCNIAIFYRHFENLDDLIICYPAFYLVLNHATFKQIKKRHNINYSDGFYIGLLYVVPLVLS